MIVRGGKARLSKMQNRLLLPMSVFDIIASTAIGFSTAPIPRGTSCTYGAIGNQTTCSIQGFSLLMMFVVISYNAMLCFYYMKVIRDNLPDRELVHYQKYMHAFACIPWITIAIVAASMQLYSSMSTFCYIGTPYEPRTEIANHAFPYIYAMMSFFVLCIFSAITYCMVSIYVSVRSKHSKMKTFDHREKMRASIEASKSLTDRIMDSLRFRKAPAQYSMQITRQKRVSQVVHDTKVQALLYVLGMLVMIIFPILSVIIDFFLSMSIPSPIRILQGIFAPSQGIWNFLAYIRPRYMIVSSENHDKSFLQKLRITILDKPSNNNTRHKRTRVPQQSPILLSTHVANPRVKSDSASDVIEKDDDHSIMHKEFRSDDTEAGERDECVCDDVKNIISGIIDRNESGLMYDELEDLDDDVISIDSDGDPIQYLPEDMHMDDLNHSFEDTNTDQPSTSTTLSELIAQDFLVDNGRIRQQRRRSLGFDANSFRQNYKKTRRHSLPTFFGQFPINLEIEDIEYDNSSDEEV